jgi:hypothetical protein
MMTSRDRVLAAHSFRCTDRPLDVMDSRIWPET